jgi:GT2 family glycosyltransferase
MISVIICSIDPVKFERVSRNYARLLEGQGFEIIGIHDATSLSEGYNRGIEQSRGKILIFSHDDVELLSPDFAGKLKSHLASHDLIGIAGTSHVVNGCWFAAGDPYVHGLVAYPEEAIYPDAKGSGCYVVHALGGSSNALVTGIQGLDGVFLATNRTVVNRQRFDDSTFDGFHVYDADFTFSAYLAGFRLGVCRDIVLIHDSLGDFGDDWNRFNARFMEKFADRLPGGPYRKRRVAASRLCGREKLMAFCEPENLRRMSDRIAAPPRVG